MFVLKEFNMWFWIFNIILVLYEYKYGFIGIDYNNELVVINNEYVYGLVVSVLVFF